MDVQEEQPQGLGMQGALEVMRARKMEAEDNRLRSVFALAQDPTADAKTRALEISRALGVAPAIAESNLSAWEQAWKESQFDPQRLRERDPLHARWLLEQEPAKAATVIRNEGWFATAARRLTAAVGWALDGSNIENWSVPGALDFVPSDTREDSTRRTGDVREEQEAAESRRLAEDLTAPRRTLNLQVDADAEAGGTLGRIAAAWGDARRGVAASKLGFDLMVATANGGDTFALENEVRRLNLTPTSRYYGQSWWEQPLIDMSTLGASQFETLKAGGLGAAVGAGLGYGLGTLLTRNPAASRQLMRVGYRAGGQMMTAASSFVLESGGAFLEFRDSKTDAGESLSAEVAIGGAMVYGAVAAAIELESLRTFLPMFGGLGDAVRAGTGKTVLKELLAKNPSFRTLAMDIFRRWGKGALGEGKEEALQSISQDLTEWLARSAQAGELQSLDVGDVSANAADAGGTAISGMGAAGGVRALPALADAGRRSLITPTDASPPGQALERQQMAVAEHQQAVTAGRQVEILAELADGQSEAVRAIPDVVAEMVQTETEASGEPVTHMYVDAGALARLYQSGVPGPDGITQEAAAAAEQLLGEGGAEKLREAVATGGRLEVPLEQYLDRWGAVQVEVPTPTDTPTGEGAAPATGRRSVAAALARDTTTRPGLALPSQVDPEMLAKVDADARRLAEEMERDSREADSEAETRFTEAMTEQLVQTRTFSRAEARRVSTLMRAFIRTQAQRFDLPVDALFGDYSILVERGRQGEWADQQFPFGANAPVPLASPPTFTRLEDVEAMEASQQGLLEQGPVAEPGAPEASRLLAERLATMSTEDRARELYIDSNTGMLNGRAFAEMPVDPAKPLVLHISIEGIKYLNDTVSHDHADGWYRTVGRLLQAEDPAAAKVGGDFAVRVASEEEGQALLQRLQAANPVPALEITGAVGDSLDTAARAHFDERLRRESLPEGDPGRRANPRPKDPNDPTGKTVLPPQAPLGLERAGIDASALQFSMDRAETAVPPALAAIVEELSAGEGEAYFSRAYVEPRTNLLTLEGWNAIPKKRFAVSVDLRGLKAVNDAMGSAAGDEFLAQFGEIADVLGGSDFDLAHLHGDEYAAQSNDEQAVRGFLARLEEAAQTYIGFDVDLPDGSVHEHRGGGFRQGVAEGSYADADAVLNAAKAEEQRREREARANQDNQPGGIRRDDADAVPGSEGDPSQLPNRRLSDVEAGRRALARRAAPQGFPGAREGRAASGRAGTDGTRLDQDETAAAGAAPRGSIEFFRDEAGARIFRVLLNPGSDRSTILHELGHAFLEMFGDLAAREDAPESVKQDWAQTLEFLGVDDRMSIQVNEHETWARAFEAYLFEGKSPSKALRGAFTRFKQWLRGVYRSIRSLNVELNEEIRGVFDRLLASEEETARARAKSGLMPLFRSPEEAVLSPEAWEAYQREVERSVSNAEFRAERVGYEEAQRELEGWWREERQRRRQDAEREYQDLPGVRAWRYLRTGEAWWLPEGAEAEAPPKLDRAAVQRLVGEGVDAPRRFSGMLEPGGVHPDDVAVLLGIPSGQQMLDAILNRPEQSRWVSERAEAMMREAHPDVLRERERLEAAAQEALHAAPTSDWLLKEWVELRRKSGQRGAPPVESIRRAAQLLAERRTLREVTPGRVLHQERSAAERAALLTARGEFGQAYVAKQQQLLNHYLWRELTQAKRERESFEGLLDQAEGDAWRGRLGLADEGRVLRDFSDTILAWLGTRPRQDGERAPSIVELQQVLGELGMEAAFDTGLVERLLQSPPLESVDARARLDSDVALGLIAELYGDEVALRARDPKTRGTSITRIQRVLREALPRGQGAQAIRDVREMLRQRGAVREAPESVATWTSITVAEMRELNAALKQVSKAATEARSVIDEGRRVAIEELAGDILADSLALPRKAPPPRSEATKSLAQRASQRWEGIRSEMIDPEEMFRRLGPTAHRFFWDGYLERRGVEQEMAKDVMAVFDRVWTDLPEGMREARHDIVDAPEITFSPDLAREGPITREQVWMIAANMGNEGNMQRLLDGYGWERGQVMALLDRVMTREEWEFIQGVWDLMDKELWPRMAEAFERQNGVRPPKVEAQPLVTRHGVFRGGYFPARYDPIESRRGGAQLLEGAANLFSDPSVRASVTKGFTKSRAERVKDVVSLEWGHVPAHVAKVIHFTAFGQWVLEAGRVLTNPTMTRAADQALGIEYRQQLEAWLKAVANPGALNSAEGVRNIARAMGAGRSFFVTTTLGYSMTVAMGDLTNPLVAVASGDVKARYIGGATATFASNPARFMRDAQALSPELRHRADNMINHIRREMGEVGAEGRRTPLTRVREHAFALFGLTDAMTASIVWDGTRRQALAQGVSDSEAVRRADETIRSLFPAVTAAEQPALLRDKHGVGALLAFFSYFSKIENRIRREWHGPLSDLALARGTPETLRALMGLAGPAGRTLAIFAVTGVLSELLSGRGPDEDEEWDEWLARKLASAPFSLVPIVGAAGEHMVGRVTSYLWQGEVKGRTFSARAAPFASFFERIGRAAETAFTTEDEEKRAWAAVEILLSALGMPTSQPLRTGRFIGDVIQGEAERDPVSGVIYGERERQPKGPVEAVQDLAGR